MLAVIGHNSGSAQSIFRSEPADNFTIIANGMLQDTRLSYEARGLLCELLSRPDDWEISVQNIVRMGVAGRDKVYRIFKELREFGYAILENDRASKGAFRQHRYAVSDDPQELIRRAAREIEMLQRPLAEKPEVVKPLTENQEVVDGPLTEKPEVVKLFGEQRLSPLTEKPEVASQPLPGKPLTDFQEAITNKRYNKTHGGAQAREHTHARIREGGARKIAATLAAGIVAAMPASAHASPAPIEQSQVGTSWQTPEAQMAASLNPMEACAQKLVWVTPTGAVQVSDDFAAELRETCPLVEPVAALLAVAPNVSQAKTAQIAVAQVRRQFGYMQQDAAKRAENADRIAKQRRDQASGKGSPNKKRKEIDLWAE